MPSALEETARLADLLRREHHALAEFLVALAAFDRDRRWVELGHSSLFDFLCRELELPKGPAYYRKTAAELIQRVPEVVQPLRAGTLCITSVIELAKVLTPENREEVLPRFFHCSRRDAQAVSAELAPMEAAPHRTVVTAIPAVTARRADVEPPVLLPLAPSASVAPVPPSAREELGSTGSRPDTSVTVRPETWVTPCAHALGPDRHCE
jgi:hypothetical protein